MVVTAWLVLIPVLALIATGFALAYLLARAFATLADIQTDTAAILRDTLNRPAPSIELPAPEVHFDFPTPPELAEPQTPTLTPDPFMVDPTDGFIPNIDVDWQRTDFPADPDIDLPYIPDPTEDTDV